MPNLVPELVRELNSLDFSVYIGGPLQAAVQAQHAASMALVDFINKVGFEKKGEENLIRYVTFKYKKDGPNPAFKGASTPDISPTTLVNAEIDIPFLVMLTMPALRIDEIVIDFNARLTSTETSNVSSEFAASAELGIDYKFVNFKASASYRSTSFSGVNVEKTYSLGVKVTARNDELPAGLDRILSLLEASIKEK